jgi:hypothetical protein
LNALDVLGVLSPSMSQAAKPQPNDPSLSSVVIPAGVGAIGGAALGMRFGHPLLGLLAGEALGANAIRVWRNASGDRVRAGTNLVAAGAGIIGSLIAQRYSKKDSVAFLGWLLGFVAGQVAVSTVPGSNSHRLVHGSGFRARHLLEGK